MMRMYMILSEKSDAGFAVFRTMRRKLGFEAASLRLMLQSRRGNKGLTLFSDQGVRETTRGASRREDH